MIDLPAELRTVHDSLSPAHRRHADQLVRLGRADALVAFLRHRVERNAAQACAVERAAPIPGRTATQAAFVAALDPGRKAVLEALPPHKRETMLEWFADSLDPVCREEAHRLLTPRQPRPAPSSLEAPAEWSADVPDPAPKRRRPRPKAKLSPRRRP